MSHDKRDLPEIPDLPEISDDLPTLGAEATLEPVGEASAPAAPKTPAPSLGPDGQPPLRELEEAPRQLQKAALIAAAGGILPWMGANLGQWTGPEAVFPLADWIAPMLAAKICAAVGAYFWLAQIKHNWGPKLTGLFGSLAEIALAGKPKKVEADKPKRRSVRDQAPTTLKHPFPTVLQVLSLVLAIVGVLVLPIVWPMGTAAKSVAEVGMFAWALYTWVHIQSYERWGSFNPLFPLMFLAMGLAGAARVVSGLLNETLKTGSGMMGVIGGGIVGVAGIMAAYTMYLSLRQAKVEGDLKKAAALDARRAARKRA